MLWLYEILPTVLLGLSIPYLVAWACRVPEAKDLVAWVILALTFLRGGLHFMLH